MGLIQGSDVEVCAERPGNLRPDIQVGRGRPGNVVGLDAEQGPRGPEDRQSRDDDRLAPEAGKMAVFHPFRDPRDRATIAEDQGEPAVGVPEAAEASGDANPHAQGRLEPEPPHPFDRLGLQDDRPGVARIAGDLDAIDGVGENALEVGLDLAEQPGVEQLAVGLWTQSLEDALEGKADSELFDTGLLDEIENDLKRDYAHSIDGIEIANGARDTRPIILKPESVERVRRLRLQTPPSMRVLVAGRLDSVRQCDRHLGYAVVKR